jgi:sugar phosphate isomerase/epimerase
MRLSCTSWSFPALTLPEVAGVARALGIPALDLGLFYASALPKARLLAEPAAVAAELAGLGAGFSNLYWLFGADLAERNLADPASLAANRADLPAVLQFCRAAGVPSLMLLPGLINPGQGRAEALAASAAQLRALLPLAQAAGVTLAVEPHVHSYLESPALALELLAQVPGLRLVLDYAHFACLGYRQEEIDPLAPHAAHVHLRQARPGALQAKLAQGTLNFPAMLATLRAAGYAGHLAIEYVHQDYMNTLYDDVLSETVAMRDLVRRFV